MTPGPQRDQQLLAAWLHGPTHLTDLANECGLSAPQVTAWAARPDIAAALAAIRDFTAARAEAFTISCTAAALARLLVIVEQSDDEQSARRAATAILRFHDRSFARTPRKNQPPAPPAPPSPSNLSAHAAPEAPTPSAEPSSAPPPEQRTEPGQESGPESSASFSGITAARDDEDHERGRIGHFVARPTPVTPRPAPSPAVTRESTAREPPAKA